MTSPRRILILRASYGSLLASKLLYAGHEVTLVCLPAEADAINKEGARVRLPVKGRKDLIELDSRKLPGTLSADGPSAINPSDYDLVALAMQEPQYRSPGVRELLRLQRQLDQAKLNALHRKARVAGCRCPGAEPAGQCTALLTGRGREHDVRPAAVSRHVDGAAEGDQPRGRRVMAGASHVHPSDQAPRWVVAHDEARLHA